MLSKLKEPLGTENFDLFIKNKFNIIDFGLNKRYQLLKTDIWYPLCQRNIDNYIEMESNLKGVNFFNGHSLKPIT
jgi:hypothetical protein